MFDGGYWMDTGKPGSYLAANRHVLEDRLSWQPAGERTESGLWEGANVQRHNVGVTHPAALVDDTVLSEGAQLFGRTVLLADVAALTLVVLRAIHERVRFLPRSCEPAVFRVTHGGADRCRYAGFCKGPSHPVTNGVHVVVAVNSHDAELVTTDPREDIPGSNRPLQRLGRPADACISRRVPVTVIDGLELVESTTTTTTSCPRRAMRASSR